MEGLNNNQQNNLEQAEKVIFEQFSSVPQLALSKLVQEPYYKNLSERLEF